MSKNFVQNALARQLLIAGYRSFARAQLWRSGPRIFVNSIPKAGTHLLTAELDKFTELQNSRLHIETRLVNAAAPDHARVEEVAIDADKADRFLGQVRKGQFFSAHLFWDDALAARLRARDIRTIFMQRDPRDILVSRLKYVLGLERHYLHQHLAKELGSDEERLRVLILGRKADPFIRPMREMLESFAPWTSADFVLTVKFEDLVGERGGGTTEAKYRALERICTHCGLSTDRLAEFARTPPKATPTLREGRSNTWRKHLSPEIVALFEAECGAATAALGYEGS
jgi:hypothetical protein